MEKKEIIDTFEKILGKDLLKDISIQDFAEDYKLMRQRFVEEHKERSEDIKKWIADVEDDIQKSEHKEILQEFLKSKLEKLSNL
ncbi:MAG: hypothetical protein KGV59_06310 [Tenacibaculum sp.]|nr:hypothetical protein [Tenacibaculum sp.]